MKRAASDVGGDEKRSKLVAAALDLADKLSDLETATAVYDAAVETGGGCARAAAADKTDIAEVAAIKAQHHLRWQLMSCLVVPRIFINLGYPKGTTPAGLLQTLRSVVEEMEQSAEPLVIDRAYRIEEVDERRIFGKDAGTQAELLRLWPLVASHEQYRDMIKSADENGAVNCKFLDLLVTKYKYWCRLRYDENQDTVLQDAAERWMFSNYYSTV